MSDIAIENRAIKQIERQFKNTRKTYLACEDLDFSWTKQEVMDFGYLWREGRTLDEMARYFKRTPEEILILALDRAKSGYIEPRKGGLLGECLSKALGDIG